MKLVADADSFRDPREPPLFVGHWARLNSGGPNLLVVEEHSDTVTVAWRVGGGTYERDFHRACLHRCR
jgi:uncharacterized protein YodC (DUF2158 family)